MDFMEKLIIDNNFSYDIFKIGNRTIYSPNPYLKAFQRNILNVLKKYYPLQLNIAKCASVHRNQKWILKMDIKHFYESIPTSALLKVLNEIAGKTSLFPFEKLKETTLVNNILPTGAATSAHIANACMKNIDKEIEKNCKALNIIYSRYMDDLFFSAQNKADLQRIEIFVSDLLKQNQLELNKDKIKYISQNKKQVIMGILVNKDKTCLPNNTKRIIKAILHQYMVGKITDENYVAGYLSYVFSIDKEYFKTLNRYYWLYKKKYNIEKSKIRIIGKLFNYNLRKI